MPWVGLPTKTPRERSHGALFYENREDASELVLLGDGFGGLDVDATAFLVEEDVPFDQ